MFFVDFASSWGGANMADGPKRSHLSQNARLLGIEPGSIATEASAVPFEHEPAHIIDAG